MTTVASEDAQTTPSELELSPSVSDPAPSLPMLSAPPLFERSQAVGFADRTTLTFSDHPPAEYSPFQRALDKLYSAHHVELRGRRTEHCKRPRATDCVRSVTMEDHRNVP